MTERERWVVYPLLFLALGAALRDKLGGSTKTKSVVCQELRIEDEPIGNQPARTLAVIRGTEPAEGAPSLGVLEIQGAVKVDGIVNANQVNANQYACQGVNLTPAFEAMENFLRALQAGAVQQPLKPRKAPPASALPPANPATPAPADGAEVKPEQPNSDSDAATPK
jgi:hypothetical protein